MIRIKDYIFNENEIEQLQEISNFTDDEKVVHEKVLQVCRKTKSDFYMLDATFDDIEWNYADKEINYLRHREKELKYYNEILENQYQDKLKEIKELEEKNNTYKQIMASREKKLTVYKNKIKELEEENKKLKEELIKMYGVVAENSKLRDSIKIIK